MLAAILISHHNLAFFLATMKRVRHSIRIDTFGKFRLAFLQQAKESE